ncbi:MAG TPA: hypothetical protein V6D16_13830 [Candidatus Obscuribacterales bacterium]
MDPWLTASVGGMRAARWEGVLLVESFQKLPEILGAKAIASEAHYNRGDRTQGY